MNIPKHYSAILLASIVVCLGMCSTLYATSLEKNSRTQQITKLTQLTPLSETDNNVTESSPFPRIDLEDFQSSPSISSISSVNAALFNEKIETAESFDAQKRKEALNMLQSEMISFEENHPETIQRYRQRYTTDKSRRITSKSEDEEAMREELRKLRKNDVLYKQRNQAPTIQHMSYNQFDPQNEEDEDIDLIASWLSSSGHSLMLSNEAIEELTSPSSITIFFPKEEQKINNPKSQKNRIVKQNERVTVPKDRTTNTHNEQKLTQQIETTLAKSGQESKQHEETKPDDLINIPKISKQQNSPTNGSKQLRGPRPKRKIKDEETKSLTQLNNNNGTQPKKNREKKVGVVFVFLFCSITYIFVFLFRESKPK